MPELEMSIALVVVLVNSMWFLFCISLVFGFKIIQNHLSGFMSCELMAEIPIRE